MIGNPATGRPQSAGSTYTNQNPNGPVLPTPGFAQPGIRQMPQPPLAAPTGGPAANVQVSPPRADAAIFPINLPTALRLGNANALDIAFATR